jgi:hypothetical protein
MDKRQLELKVGDLIDRVKNGQTVEDSTIELKTTWPGNEQEAARQLGGHANAARGEPLLWIIGVDEKQRKVCHVEQKELANWLPAVAKNFDGPCPKLALNVPIHVDGYSITALYFETDQSPYVVRNPVFGKPNGGPVQLEVPWREGNSTRSATRADLLKVLLKVVKRPSVTVLGATMTLTFTDNGQEGWLLCVDLYVVPMDGSTVFPSHLWIGEFFHVYRGETLSLEVWPDTIEETAHGGASLERINCVGPMKVRMFAEKVIPFVTKKLPSEINARISLGIAGVDNLPVVLDLRMSDMKKQDDGSFTWEQGKPPKTGSIRTLPVP